MPRPHSFSFFFLSLPSRAINIILITLLALSSCCSTNFCAQAFLLPHTTKLAPSSSSLPASPPLSRRRLLSRAATMATAGAVDGTTSSRKLLTSDIPFQLYNTASRKKEPFTSVQKGKVSFYSCGPTVYDFAHIGNFRAFLTYDILKRWLMYCGYAVNHICNLTDVDDKIIKRMARDNLSLPELTNKYANIFFEDLRALNIVPASHYPRATEHIDDIVQMVQDLVDRGYAYESQGSFYFRTSKFASYGKLAWLDFGGMETGAGEGGGINDADEYIAEKGDAKDFALWKAYKEEDGPVFWETALGKGRPGWHIECSAMARRFLGDTLDVHAGGVDLVFPHHENEIAQSEAATGNPFCNCWVHNGFVNVDNEKMSKSKGNFLTLRATLQSDLDLRAFRYLVVTSQYRTPLNFNAEGLQGARKTVQRLDKLRAALEEKRRSGEGEGGGEEQELQASIGKALTAFEAGMADDLNTPRAAAALFTLVKNAEKAVKGGALTATDAKHLVEALEKMDTVLGIFYEPPAIEGVRKEAVASGEPTMVLLEELPSEVQDLIARRGEAKEGKDWELADELRDELKTKYKLVLKDVKGGTLQITREA